MAPMLGITRAPPLPKARATVVRFSRRASFLSFGSRRSWQKPAAAFDHTKTAARGGFHRTCRQALSASVLSSFLRCHHITLNHHISPHGCRAFGNLTEIMLRACPPPQLLRSLQAGFAPQIRHRITSTCGRTIGVLTTQAWLLQFRVA